MHDLPNSFSAVIDAFGGAGPFGAAIGVNDSHARTMKARDSIPWTRWQDTVKAAAERNIEGVTLERLADMATVKRELERAVQ